MSKKKSLPSEKPRRNNSLRKVVRLARAGAVSEPRLPLLGEDGTIIADNPAAHKSARFRGRIRHERRKIRERRYYGSQIAALYALCALSVWQWGWHVLLLIITAVLSAVLTDFVCCRLAGKKYSARDKSTLCAGICAGLMLPWNISPGIAVLGAALAICVKHIFGGRRGYIFSPTAVAVCFLIICYPAAMLLYTPPPPDAPSVSVVAKLTTSTTVTAPNLGVSPASDASVTVPDVPDSSFVKADRTGYLTGQFLGASGTVHLLVILVCGVVLAMRRAISLSATAGIVAASLAVTWLFSLIGADAGFTARYFVAGGGFSGSAGAYFPFAVVFLLSDPQILPKTRLGRAYYGVFAGVFEAAFFYFGKTGGSILFALLAADIFALRCDLYAAYARKLAGRVSVLLNNRVHGFEQVREASARHAADHAAITAAVPALPYENSLPDITRELDLSLLRYDMPPIQGKVTKVTRKKYVLLHFVSKNVKKVRRMWRKRGKQAEKTQSHKGVILPYMREGLHAVRARVRTILRVRPKLTPIEAAAEAMHTESATEKAPPQNSAKKENKLRKTFLGIKNRLANFKNPKSFPKQTGEEENTANLRISRRARAKKEKEKAGGMGARVTRRTRTRVPKAKSRRASRTRGAGKGRKQDK